MKFNKSISIVFFAVITASCNHKPGKQSDTDLQRKVFFDKSGMDTTAGPGENFFQYANGKWYDKTNIPANKSSIGSFTTVDDQNDKNLRSILDSLSSSSLATGSRDQKIGDLYASGMDTVTIDKKGYTPVKAELAKIAAITDARQLISFCAEEYKEGNDYLLGFDVGPDDKNSNKNMVSFNQTGLGLPNRDYYTKTDSASVKIRAEYLKYISKLFILTGTDQSTAAKNAADILKLETAIALSHSTPNELRDPVKNYHKLAVTDLQKKSGMDLDAIFSKMGFNTDTVLVGQPGYFIALNRLLKTEPIEVWKKKLEFTALNSSANYLSEPFQDAYFDFFGKILSGQKVQKERWKRMTKNVDASLGELLGQLYVAKYFSPDAKKRMLDLVNNLQNVYKDRIKKLDWMSDDTKKKAIDKLNAFTKRSVTLTNGNLMMMSLSKKTLILKTWYPLVSIITMNSLKRSINPWIKPYGPLHLPL